MSSAGEHARRLKQRSRLEHCAACEQREQRLTANLAKFRDKTRIRAHAGPCPDDSFCAGNIVELTDLRVPSGDVALGTSVPVSVDLTNHGQNVGFLDPDRCDNSNTPCGTGGSTEGVCVELIFNIEWAGDRSHTTCSRIALNPAQTKTVDINLPSSSSAGQMQVSVFARLWNSDKRSAAITKSVSFTETGSDNPTPNGDGDNGDEDGGGPFLPCLIDPNRSCDSPADTILQGVALLLLIVVLAGAAAPG